MTKFKNYINESPQYDSYLDDIKKDCKPFLKDFKTRYNNNFLWTGRDEYRNFIKKQVRRDRIPRDTPLEIHEFIDNWFYKKFGIRFRSNAVFASLDMDIVSDYGPMYAIFPIGKYTTLSSPHVKDLWIDILKEQSKYKWKNLTQKEKDEFIDNIQISLEKAKYKLNTFHYYNEIMIHCKEYYILSYEVLREMSKEDFII